MRVFAYPTEDEVRVKSLLERLAPGAKVAASKADSAHGVVITVLEVRLEKKRAVETFFRGLGPEILGKLMGSVPERMDASGHLYFRLEKQELVLGRVRLAVGGDTVAIECSAHGPRAKAEETMKSALAGMLDPGD